MKKLIAILCLLSPAWLLADERILAFNSDIVVSQDGWIEVTETITVRSAGQQIRRGIYRDFPTRYRDAYGNDVEVIYQPLSLLRNDAREDFRSEKVGNGVRTYFGNANRMLENGVHTYTFRYAANRMLGFFDEHDELYWNVTGHDWYFPIERASATVTLDFPGEPLLLESVAFTGTVGARGSAYSKQMTGSRVTFATTKALAPHAGLTIVAMWPKGFVTPPDSLQKIVWFLQDNLSVLVLLGGLIIMLIYLIPVWRAYGRDPEEGLIVTRYEPPEGFSPASLRFIHQMYYDNKVMTAAIINLAVKGYLRIENADDVHTLVKTGESAQLPALATGERELFEALFARRRVIVLENDNLEIINAARTAHRTSLRRDYRGRYFKSNGLLSLPALAVGIVSSVIALNVGGGPSIAVFVAMLLMLIVFAVFAVLMKRPTGLGRNVLDETLGFQDYLEIAEKDEMNLLNPPEKTPQLFETFLPFALALGVEQHWAERFSSVFARLSAQTDAGYRPAWYSGAWNSFDLGATTSALSSDLGSAISSSVTPPGSSSGGGGGGFSGGGGGGGGGGGW
ncbi:MAG: DUF2207 domain-containing protein [Gammaproteobacteria bacterium]|nr:DUF2207 domain-containing protein [Gammaproteobacteria bacterium]